LCIDIFVYTMSDFRLSGGRLMALWFCLLYSQKEAVIAKKISGSSPQEKLVRKSANDIIRNANSPSRRAELARPNEVPDHKIDYSDAPP
jgi:hypothetical protein